VSKAPSWLWRHPKGRYSVVGPGGTLIDDRRCIYFANGDGIRKYDASGTLLWFYESYFSHAPSLDGDEIYGITADGFAFAVGLESGAERWRTRVVADGNEDTRGLVREAEWSAVPKGMGSGICTTGVYGGLLLGPTGQSTGPFMPGGSTHVTAVNVTDGAVAWHYHADNQLWNFQPHFTGNGTFVFQDQHGGVYHMTLAGKLLWKSGHTGIWAETWTDGEVMLHDQVVYAAHSEDYWDKAATRTPQDGGDYSAYRLSDGELLWRWVSPLIPNSQPVIVKSPLGSGLSVVMPIGSPMNPPGALQLAMKLSQRYPAARRLFEFSGLLSTFLFTVPVHLLGMILGDRQQWLFGNAPWPTSVVGLDAATGALQWQWSPPDWLRATNAGDEEGFFPRMGGICSPNPWSSPSQDASGTIYLGHLSGEFYALRDANGDGLIDATEVSSYRTGSAFSNPGPALGPGLLAVADCDTLYVWSE